MPEASRHTAKAFHSTSCLVAGCHFLLRADTRVDVQSAYSDSFFERDLACSLTTVWPRGLLLVGAHTTYLL
jgi:hypothetical protein